MSKFVAYYRKNIVELRRHVKGEPMADISVADGVNPDDDGGVVARDPDNHNDQWYIPKEMYEKMDLETV